MNGGEAQYNIRQEMRVENGMWEISTQKKPLLSAHMYLLCVKTLNDTLVAYLAGSENHTFMHFSSSLVDKRERDEEGSRNSGFAHFGALL